MATSQVTVAPLNTEDVTAVQALLIAGLRERWGCYQAHFNADIESFPESYASSTVLVAKKAGSVVGTGILQAIGNGQFQIVRMSVAAPCRRAGVGSLILHQLLQLSRLQAAQAVVLETTSTWSSAIAFYTKHGFVKTHEQGQDSYFQLKFSEA